MTTQSRADHILNSIGHFSIVGPVIRYTVEPSCDAESWLLYGVYLVHYDIAGDCEAHLCLCAADNKEVLLSAADRAGLAVEVFEESTLTTTELWHHYVLHSPTSKQGQAIWRLYQERKSEEQVMA